jgi:hypothetical protein
VNRRILAGMYIAIFSAFALSAWVAIGVGNLRKEDDSKAATIAGLVDDVTVLRAQITDLCSLPNTPNCVPVAPAPSPEVVAAAAGERGPQGDAGERGLPGRSPTVSEILDAVRTFCLQNPVACKGDDGATGSPGAPGQSVTGDTGATGATGAQGATGATGTQGSPGADGATGATGATGASGPAGPQGEPGVAGPAGPQGDPGPAGPQGPPPSGGTIIIPGIGTFDCVPDSADPTRFVCTPQGAA